MQSLVSDWEDWLKHTKQANFLEGTPFNYSNLNMLILISIREFRNCYLKFIKRLTLRISLYLLSLIGILVIIIIQQLCEVFTSLTINGVIIHSAHVLQCVLEIVALASETN